MNYQEIKPNHKLNQKVLTSDVKCPRFGPICAQSDTPEMKQTTIVSDRLAIKRKTLLPEPRYLRFFEGRVTFSKIVFP